MKWMWEHYLCAYSCTHLTFTLSAEWIIQFSLGLIVNCRMSVLTLWFLFSFASFSSSPVSITEATGVACVPIFKSWVPHAHFLQHYGKSVKWSMECTKCWHLWRISWIICKIQLVCKLPIITRVKQSAHVFGPFCSMQLKWSWMGKNIKVSDEMWLIEHFWNLDKNEPFV